MMLASMRCQNTTLVIGYVAGRRAVWPRTNPAVNFDDTKALGGDTLVFSCRLFLRWIQLDSMKSASPSSRAGDVMSVMA